MIDAPDPASSSSQEPPEELARCDDAVIGRAFRWSVVAALLLGACGAIVYVSLHRKPAAAPPKVSPIVAPTALISPTEEVPMARFTDITSNSGIAFTHVN